MSTPKRSAAASALLSEPDDPVAVELDIRERWKTRVFNQAVELAIKDDDFRKRLAAKLVDLGEGRLRRSTALFDVLQVASMVEVLWLNCTGTRKAHLLKKPRLFEEVAERLGITKSQAKLRYYKAMDLGMLGFLDLPRKRKSVPR